MRSEKGITLVALIAVFVLLVVLAGISISLVLTDAIEKQPAVVETNTVNQEETINNAENEIVEETSEVVENVVNEVSNNVVDENVVEE